MLQFCCDVVLASIAMYVTSSAVIISLYLLLIVLSSFLLGRTQSIVIAALSGLAYALLVSGLIPTEHSIPKGSADILSVYASLVLVSLLSSFIAGKTEAQEQQIMQGEKEFDEFSRRQDQLFQGLSEGMITVDLDSAITGINSAAQSIIGLRDLEFSSIVGTPVSRLFPDSPEVLGALSKEKGSVQAQARIRRAEGDSEVSLSFHVNDLKDAQGTRNGRVIRFTDISEMRSMEEQLHLHEKVTKLLSERSSEVTTVRKSSDRKEIIGDSGIIAEKLSVATKVAASDAPVLLGGESGTGKEVFARFIHRSSSRKGGPFVAINCGAIPESLIESQLFGHLKGSFTGATRDAPGLFRDAENGTVFLDEVGELPLHLQSKLLRVLQEKHISPVGSSASIPVNTRIIAATNLALKAEVKKGTFREDLYYRLNVVEINLPSLRERKEDIPLLVTHFMKRLADEHSSEGTQSISPEALQLLVNHDFPGNIRELENLVSRAMVLGGSVILAEHLPEELRAGGKRSQAVETLTTEMQSSAQSSFSSKSVSLPVSLETELEDLEKRYLLEALKRSDNVKKDAAELLGLNFRSFRYRLKKYDL